MFLLENWETCNRLISKRCTRLKVLFNLLIKINFLLNIPSITSAGASGNEGVDVVRFVEEAILGNNFD